jgi:glycosyltransferase involved in cell wall biosynthesis
VPYLKPVLWTYLRVLHNRADLNLCTSETTKTELEKKKFRRLLVWKRGVALERFSPSFFDHNIRLRLTNGAPDKKLLLFVGRLAAEKNIESLRGILEASPDYCLALVGDGPFRPTLEKHFEGTHTVFCGYLLGEELSRAYASSDVFIFPSTTETLGLVLMEAMAAGLPIVAARSGPTCEQIEDGETGVLFDPDERDSMLAAVQSLNNRVYRDRISVQASAYVQSYGWEDSSEQLYNIYCEVLVEKKVLDEQKVLSI